MNSPACNRSDCGRGSLIIRSHPRRLTMAAIQHSYMVTNRANPTNEQGCKSIYPLPSGKNYWFTAPQANDSTPSDYNPIGAASASMPASFQRSLEQDIAAAVVAKGVPQVTLLIHGLAYQFSEACGSLGTVGQNLATMASFNGLLVGFSWPSYDTYNSINYYGLPYTTFPPPPQNTSGTIRGNINGSTSSLLSFLNQLVPLCTSNHAKLNIICHSEGNYMLMLAMNVLAHNLGQWPHLTKGFIDQTMIVAADINHAALQVANGTAGQFAPLGNYSKGITIYWSGADSLLPCGETWTTYHNPDYPWRLGLHGPKTNESGTFLSQAIGLDCTAVVNNANGNTPFTVSVHESYFYIPQVLTDMAAIFTDTAPGSVPNRRASGNQSYQMVIVPNSPKALTCLQPSGNSCTPSPPAKG
jgi:esterase/lipase superfamily enzyme